MRTHASRAILSLVTSAVTWAVVGCARVTPPLAGTYAFPEGAERHHPWFILGADGSFRFQDAPGLDPGELGAAGTYRVEGNELVLRYTEAVCCQFSVGDGDEERLPILRADADSITVRFGSEPIVLKKSDGGSGAPPDMVHR